MRLCLSLVLASLLTWTAVAAAPSSAVRLAAVLDDVLAMPVVVFSPDGSAVAYVATKRKKYLVVTGNKRSAEYEKVGTPLWLSGSKTWAYAAADGQGWLAMVGDHPGPQFDSIREDMAVSPAGDAVAYVASRGGHEMVVAGDRVGDAFDLISTQTPVWNARGDSVAYAATTDKKQYMVAGQGKRGPYALVGKPTWSADGSTVAYAAWTDSGGAIKARMVSGDQVGPAFDKVYDPVFSTDGALAYVAAESGKEFVIANGRRGPAWPVVGGLTWSRDGKHLAYATGPGTVWGDGRRRWTSIVVDGVPQRYEYDSVSAPILGSGRTVAYVASKGGKSWVVCGTEVGSPFDEIKYLQLGFEDQPTYAARLDDKWFVVRGQHWTNIYYRDVEHLMLSPDGHHAAAIVQDTTRRRWMLYGHQTSPALSDVYWPPSFSDDCQEVGFGARRGSEFWWWRVHL